MNAPSLLVIAVPTATVVAALGCFVRHAFRTRRRRAQDAFSAYLSAKADLDTMAAQTRQQIKRLREEHRGRAAS